MRSVILDRYYLYPLLDYLYRLSGDSRFDGVEEDANEAEIAYTLSSAALLYDKILIEDSFGSALEHRLGISDAASNAWSIFQKFSPDQMFGGDAEHQILVESVQKDLLDNELLDRISEYDAGVGRRTDHESAVWYLNRILHAAKLLDCAILPSPSRYPLFAYKFEESKSAFEEDVAREVMQTVMELEVPRFEVSSLSDLVELRKHPCIESFRSKIWEMSSYYDNAGEVQINQSKIVQTLTDEKNKIITELRPKLFDYGKMIASWFIPFPYNVPVDAATSAKTLHSLRKHRWQFFLCDIMK